MNPLTKNQNEVCEDEVTTEDPEEDHEDTLD